ncbi:MAG: hypothetical protein AAB606_03835, partial [Patescibacteria group bacterium]
MAHASKHLVRAKFFAIIAVVFFLGTVSYAALAASAEENIFFVPVTPSELDKSKGDTNKLKSLQDNLKSIRLELQGIKTAVKNIDTTTIDSLLNQWEACIQARQADVGKDVFNTNMEKCYLLNTSAKDEFYKNIFPQRNCAETKKRINEYKKEKKDMERQIKDLLRGDKTRDIRLMPEDVIFIPPVGMLAAIA